MSVTTWTPTALASSARAWSGKGWRAVEAQHKVATMGLVGGDLASQALLEEILDTAKPRLPESTAGLHWLLATPFRYWPLPGGSRFRGRYDPGVFYGAEDRPTACAESGYWRLRFWMDSEFLQGQSKSVALTLFEFAAATPLALDLTAPPLLADHERWTAPADYSATQALATGARGAGIEAIRYQSVRYPGGVCLALLDPAPFRRAEPAWLNQQQSWTLLIRPPACIVWQRELVDECWRFEFPQP